jgi:polyisoprenoid-binding protein YceI
MSHRPIAAALVLAALALVAPRPGRAATWEIDPTHSSVQFSVRHMMVSNVRGEFGKFAGTIAADEANPAAARVEATIDSSSIDTRNEKRDEHLRSADFLDTGKFPTITFRSKKIEKAGAAWKVTGDLTLHGVTREVVLDVDQPTAPVKDPWGALRSGTQARTKISRRDFGIAFNKALDGGGVLVGDEVTITIDVEVKQAAAAPQ